jgi:carbohydrate-selective porin OprB
MDISPRFCKVLLLVLIALLCVPNLAVAQDTKTTKSTFNLETNQYLLGDWDGGRTRLANKGITFDFFFVSDMFAAATGGPSTTAAHGTKGQDVSGWNRVRGTMDIDFGKLADIKGLTVHVTGLWQGGTNQGAFLGVLANPSGLVSAHTTRLDSFWAQYAFFDNKFSVKAGQFAAMDFYGINYVGGNFLIEPIDYGFGSRFQDYTSFDPASGPAAEIQINPIKQAYLRVGVYSGNHNPYGDDTSGFGFTAKNNATIDSEIGFLYDQPVPGGTKDKYYPGRYLVGSTFNGGRFFSVSDILNDSDYGTSANYQIYVMGYQALYRPVAHSNKGLDAFFGFDMSPTSVVGDVITHTNTINREVTAGLMYTGLFPHRDKDSLNFGFVYSGISSNYNKYVYCPAIIETGITGSDPITCLTSEKAYEFNYVLHITPYMYIQPTVQVYQDPGANPTRNTVVNVGARVFVDF